MRGQITIPKYLRDKYRLKAGDEVLVDEAGGKIVLTPKLSDPVAQGRGFLVKRFPGMAHLPGGTEKSTGETGCTDDASSSGGDGSPARLGGGAGR